MQEYQAYLLVSIVWQYKSKDYCAAEFWQAYQTFLLLANLIIARQRSLRNKGRVLFAEIISIKN